MTYIRDNLDEIRRAHVDNGVFPADEYPLKPIATGGNDTLWGEGGFNNSSNNADNMNGDPGDDRMFGGNGNDTISGSTGEDLLYGQKGNDTLYGGDNNDVLRGGEGNDDLYGDAGDDILDGDGLSPNDIGDDILDGGAGNDTLVGGGGFNTFIVGDGDTIIDSDLGSNAPPSEGQVVFNNVILRGGNKNGIDYKDDNGNTYRLQSGTLTVTGSLDSFTIQNFKNMDLGIYLGNRNNPGTVLIPTINNKIRQDLPMNFIGLENYGLGVSAIQRKQVTIKANTF